MVEFIKCCPFCGSNEVEVCKTGPYWIECAKCGARANSDRRRKLAIAKWNQREHNGNPAIVVFDMGKP